MHDRPWINHYDPGVPHEIDIPPNTLIDVFKDAVRKFGSSTCLIHKEAAYTYQQVDTMSNSVAGYLLASGLNKGDRVGIMLGNTPEFVISYYGVLMAGGVVMALNPTYRPAEIEQLAGESGVVTMILHFSAYDAVKEIQEKLAIDSLIVVGAQGDSLASGDIPWENLFDQDDDYPFNPVDLKPDDPAIFQYSGGTTGTPKCAVGLHRNLVANVFQFNHWLVNTQKGCETVLVTIPAYHVYGMVLGVNLSVKMGARMILIENPGDLDSLLAAIENYQATVFPGVPNLYAAINRYPPVVAGDYDLSSIKACISGSATLPLRVKQEFEALTHGHLVEGYGLSEAPTATHCNPVLGENRDGSIGLPLPNVDCRIVDLETGNQTLPVGEIGELVVRGPQVMAGYHQHPEETKLAIRDGWLFTGDVARMDAEGYYYLVDRKKDVIKVGGFQVWPNEIEKVIFQHPKVQEVAVAGVTDEEGGEVAKAWIVPKENQIIEPEEIVFFCNQFLTRYKIPKYIEFRSSFPRTRVGKVLRRVLISEHEI
jgi:long-chain acyl-CoA synthetase